jgi:hypothetical protein
MDYPSDDGSQPPVKDPIQQVQDLVEITLKTQLSRFLLHAHSLRSMLRDHTVVSNVQRWLLKKPSESKKPPSPANTLEW